jgi:hypothetical protein
MWWIDHDRVVLEKRANEAWFRDRGFRVKTQREGADLYWADLLSDTSDIPLAPKYGRGVNSADAVKSARSRFEVEELGRPAV